MNKKNHIEAPSTPLHCREGRGGGSLIQWSDISRYRGELMGVAILIVVLFHLTVARQSPFFGLKRMGNLGVDIFFFLSGIGLWFSWTKLMDTQSKRPYFTFYARRYLRVYPAWLVIACLFYIQDYLGPHKESTSLIDLIGDITINWDFWLHDELHFWYVPATMMLYMFAPFYMNLVRRHPMYRWLPAAMMVWCCTVQWVGPIHQAVGHLEIFWSRVPIFFIGINVGEMIRQKQQMEGSSWVLILLLFAMTLGTCIYLEQVLHGKFPLFIERMIYIPLTISSVLVLTKVFTWLPSWGLRALRFVGGISLEIYLIHCQFVLLPLEKHKWGYWLTFLACMAITIPLAWGLQKIIKSLTPDPSIPSGARPPVAFPKGEGSK